MVTGVGLSVLGIGQSGSAAALAAMDAGGNQDVGVTMLRKALDASASSVTPLLASLPNAAPAAGAGATVGSQLDIRL